MKTLIKKAFRQLFGMDVRVINRSDIDIAIYVMNKKLSKLNDKKLSELEPDFGIIAIGRGFDLWNYRITIFDDKRENPLSSESVSTYNSAEKTFVELMKSWFDSEILMKFIRRNTND